MSSLVELKLPKWPFFVSDAAFLGIAYFIFHQSKLPIGAWEIFFCVLAVGLGALIAITPFLLEFRAAVRLAETEGLASTVEQIEHLDLVAIQISRATSQWQSVQEESTKTIGAAREIAERMTAEARAYADFVQKTNTSEKANLRLEIEKLRRSESDWLQVLMRILDHVYALHQAAVRSGQRSLIEQLGHFQASCLDVARRIGLLPFGAEAGIPFDATRHRLLDENATPPAQALVAETIATGYTYQGQLLRQALVTVSDAASASGPAQTSEEQEDLRAEKLMSEVTAPLVASGQLPAAKQPPLI